MAGKAKARSEGKLIQFPLEFRCGEGALRAFSARCCFNHPTLFPGEAHVRARWGVGMYLPQDEWLWPGGYCDGG